MELLVLFIMCLLFGNISCQIENGKSCVKLFSFFFLLLFVERHSQHFISYVVTGGY